ncbi:hypothetical protein FK515_30955, partial [Klebsiella pneumoniae]|nr:hypothetical protein [Klebsiella pneumoniae]
MGIRYPLLLSNTFLTSDSITAEVPFVNEISLLMNPQENLNKLMTNLRSTHPHFVRCIIPN